MFLPPLVSGEVRCHGQDVLWDRGSSFNNNQFFFYCLLRWEHHCYALLGQHLEDIANAIASLFSHRHESLMV